MSDVRTATMKVERTARYGILGRPGPEVREVWFVLHGYGHTAETFLDGFRPLARPSRLFVAPEGLSRFYLRGAEGDVGASWMTRVEREGEISDQGVWLDALQAEIFGEIARADVSVHLFGFSQGAAAACRWLVRGALRADRMTLWAGGVPPDVDLSEFTAKLPPAGLRIVIGARDHYIDAERIALENARLGAAGVPFEFVGHPGGHRLVPDLLVSLFAEG